MNEKNEQFVTNDIGLAAFLLMKGVPVSAIENKRPYVFCFDNVGSICEKLSIEFLNSESSKFDDAMKKIKIILNNSK